MPVLISSWQHRVSGASAVEVLPSRSMDICCCCLTSGASVYHLNSGKGRTVLSCHTAYTWLEVDGDCHCLQRLWWHSRHLLNRYVPPFASNARADGRLEGKDGPIKWSKWTWAQFIWIVQREYKGLPWWHFKTIEKPNNFKIILKGMSARTSVKIWKMVDTKLLSLVFHSGLFCNVRWNIET